MADQTTHYTVLARRFRPQTFDQVVGQRHVVRALQNAVCSGRVAHAYLFTGARGVGKTSTARILARALNCPDAVDGIPCGTCEICEGIASGSDVDVLEIDGASNRGIDDIRALRANVTVKSMRTKFKIYIIDEVHMLTREAFNALLKTLEEPPSNVKFVFCTTEPNKVPDTILSRCQRFDFSSIDTGSILERLEYIAQAEGCDIQRDVLELVARRAGGSMRDSQSLFDQLLAFAEQQITTDDVHQLLGTADNDRLIALFSAIVERRPDRVLAEFDAALAQGVQIGELIDQLLDYARDVMVVAAGATESPLLSVTEAQRPAVAGHASVYGTRTAVAALQILSETQMRIHRGMTTRTLAELALVQLATLQDLDRIENLIHRVAAKDHAGPDQAQASDARPAPERSTTEPRHDTQAEKKTESDADRESDMNTRLVVTDPSESGHVELKAGNEQEFLAQLVSNINDMSQISVRAASVAAISGPNHLALTFPRSYDFHKRHCERLDVLDRLQETATRIAGQPVRISLHLSSDPDESTTIRASKSGLQTPSIPQDDEFVQEAVRVFGARVVKVEHLGSDS